MADRDQFTNDNSSPLSDVAARLVEMVDRMAAGLGTSLGGHQPITLDLSLERDLGFDSLSRLELVQRSEAAFDISLPEQALSRIETIRDLMRELEAAKGRVLQENLPLPTELEASPAAVAPRTLATLNEVLEWHAARHPKKRHVTLLADDREADHLTFEELLSESQIIASGLQGHDLAPGEAILIMLPTGRDYFVSFFGALLAGGVPVPVYPPGRPQQLQEHVKRHAAIARNAGATVMITTEDARQFGGFLTGQAHQLRHIVTCADLAKTASLSARPVMGPNDTAFIQYTSGSTGDPKGVTLSHANLLANIRGMGDVLDAGPDDVFVSWLPLYHDMGLIGAWLGSLVHGIPLVIMSPLSFLARPSRWLKAISDYGGTISGGPNFAFEACVQRISAEDRASLDLSSWRVGFCGAEPVSWATLKAFAHTFAETGFRRETLMPVYGLAESSVGLTFPPLGRAPVVDYISRSVFYRSGRADPLPESDPDAMAVPGCGYPLPGHQVRVVDTLGREVADRMEGGLQFQGPSATSGYFRNPDATKALFDGEWLRSGDLAYTVGGEVFLTGREKDIVIKAGRNIFPAELETAIGQLKGIQPGGVAVFSVPSAETGTERMIVMAETRRRNEAARDDLMKEINALSTDLVGVPPDQIDLVPPRIVPKTSSGKIRRRSARDLFLRGYKSEFSGSLEHQAARLAVGSARSGLRRAGQTAAAWAYNIYAYSGGSIIALAVLTAVFAVPSLPVRRRVIGRMVRFYASLIGIHVRLEGAGNMPAQSPVLFASNHASYADVLFCSALLMGDYRFVAKAELGANFLVRLVLGRLGAYFVDRFDPQKAVQDVDDIIERVKEGASFFTFPEGTLSRMAGLLPFQPGVFRVAVETGTPVWPVVIRGTRQVLRDKNWFIRPGTVTIEIRPPHHPDDSGAKPGDGPWERSLALRDRVRAEILARCGEPDLGREKVLWKLADETRAKT